MSEKIKNKIITACFIIILFTLFIVNIIKKDDLISLTERRKLSQFPTITLENITKGKASKEWENYVVDQFVARDFFRSIKTLWSEYIFRQKDNNGLFVIDNGIYKIEYPLNKENVQKSAEKIKNVYNKYLSGKKAYYAIVPDKNYYLGKDILKIDVSSMQNIMKNTLPEMEYIDLTNALTLEDYYKTDLHWKQENLLNVVKTINKKMNLPTNELSNYKIQNMGNFYGTYYGQLGKKLSPDSLNILINDTIENANVYNYETKQTKLVYDKEKWASSSDKYDIYLSGATPLLTIENNNAKNQKELLLFRDSFGSSIAPLLLENYSKITLIDLRYVSSNVLNQYVDFQNQDQDILFLYSTLVLNQNILR